MKGTESLIRYWVELALGIILANTWSLAMPSVGLETSKLHQSGLGNPQNTWTRATPYSWAFALDHNQLLIIVRRVPWSLLSIFCKVYMCTQTHTPMYIQTNKCTKIYIPRAFWWWETDKWNKTEVWLMRPKYVMLDVCQESSSKEERLETPPPQCLFLSSLVSKYKHRAAVN